MACRFDEAKEVPCHILLRLGILWKFLSLDMSLWAFLEHFKSKLAMFICISVQFEHIKYVSLPFLDIRVRLWVCKLNRCRNLYLGLWSWMRNGLRFQPYWHGMQVQRNRWLDGPHAMYTYIGDRSWTTFGLVKFADDYYENFLRPIWSMQSNGIPLDSCTSKSCWIS